MQHPLLEICDLRVVFEDSSPPVVAVDNIRFSIAPGESLGLVGESGSGKSITALSIMRLLDFENGSIQKSGRMLFLESAGKQSDLMQLKKDEMRRIRGKRIAMIFQEPMHALNPVMRCGDQITEALKLHKSLDDGAAKKAALELLQKVQIQDVNRAFISYPFQLSGGQKQRILIAIALAGNPELLIADEPTTALDVHVQKAILDLLKDLRQEFGMSMLFISHDLGVVSAVCDRILVMKNGKIVEAGPAKSLFEDAQHPYTRGLAACRPKLEERLNRLPELKDFLPDASGNMPSPEEVRSRIGAASAWSKTDDAPLLQLEQGSVWFESPRKHLFSRKGEVVKAVHDVDLQVFPGETIGLVGASGSGKTTLGRTLVGLLPLNSGKLSFRGQTISDLDAASWQSLRKDLQMVFQDPYSSLNPRKSIGEAIREPLQVHQLVDGKQAQRDRVVELLELVGLEADHYHRHPHAFSGGQRQRICIARALTLEPDFLICDESVSALDVSIQAQVLNLLKDLQDKLHFSCIFISHDLAVVNFIADRILVMDQGKIVEQGVAGELYKNPQSEITRRLVEASRL
ncbi:MAG: ABC transporter ATP-binding protein [Bacteroidetes bacterium]|nr:ABC transporter ATP-binding protein [Bacteroidota bacterium]